MGVSVTAPDHGGDVVGECGAGIKALGAVHDGRVTISAGGGPNIRDVRADVEFGNFVGESQLAGGALSRGKVFPVFRRSPEVLEGREGRCVEPFEVVDRVLASELLVKS